MCETCRPGSFSETPLSVGEIREYFPDAIEVYTGSRHFDGRHSGEVYVIDLGHVRRVKMPGACPNLQGGICKRGSGCFARLAVGKKNQ